MRKFVIAGTNRQFNYFFPEKDKDVICVNSVRDLIGQHEGKLVKVGTWYEREDIDDLLISAVMRGISE